MAGPVKSRTNVVVHYNAVPLELYCSQADLSSTLSQLEVTDLASTAKEYITDLPEWRIRLQGYWDSTMDTAIAVDAVTPGTKRTAYISFNDDATTITYTWTAAAGVGAEIGSYQITGSATAALTFSAELILSGAPVRA